MADNHANGSIKSVAAGQALRQTHAAPLVSVLFRTLPAVVRSQLKVIAIGKATAIVTIEASPNHIDKRH